MNSNPRGVQDLKEHDMTQWKKTSHRLAACAGVLVGCVTALAGADTVCAWNFNLDMDEKTVCPADHGVGTLDATVSEEWLRSYAGTTLGAILDDEAGRSMGFRGDVANGSGFELAFSATGEHILQFAYRSTKTGFHDCTVEHFTGTEWAPIGTFGDIATASEWTNVSLELPDLSGSTRLRLILDGATSSSSTARFDNLRVTTVPAPAAMLTMSELVVCGVRPRRGAKSST